MTKRTLPDFKEIGPAMVHLFLEVHPMYYRGPMGYDENRQASSARKVFDLVKNLFQPMPDESLEEAYRRSANDLDGLFTRAGTRELLGLLRPRMWWKELETKYTMTDATRIIADEDARWASGGYAKRVQNTLEDMLSTAYLHKEDNEDWEVDAIKNDWRNVLMVQRPLDAASRRAFLEEISGLGTSDIHKFLFRAFREMPALGEALQDTLSGFPDADLKKLNAKSPFFALYMSGMSTEVFEDLLNNWRIGDLEETFKQIKKKNFVSEEMRDFWENKMPFQWQDMLLAKERREEPIERKRSCLTWVNDLDATGAPAASRMLSLMRQRGEYRNKINADPVDFINAAGDDMEKLMIAVMINGKNIKFIPEKLRTYELKRLAVENPSPLLVKLIATPLNENPKNIPASGLESLKAPIDRALIEMALREDPNNFFGIPLSQREDFARMTLDLARESGKMLHPKTMEALVRTEVSVDLLADIIHYDPDVLKIMKWDMAPTIKFHPENFNVLARLFVSGWNDPAHPLYEQKRQTPALMHLKQITIRDFPDSVLESAIQDNPMNHRFIPESRRTEKMGCLAIAYAQKGMTLEELDVNVKDLAHWKIAVKSNPDNLYHMKWVLGGRLPDNEVLLESAIHYPARTSNILGYPTPESMFESLYGPGLAHEYQRYAANTPGLPQLLSDWISSDKIRKEREMNQPKVVINHGNLVEQGNMTINNGASETKESEKKKGFFAKLMGDLSGTTKMIAGVSVAAAMLAGVHAYNPTLLPQSLGQNIDVAERAVMQQVKAKAPEMSAHESMQRIMQTAMVYEDLCKQATIDRALAAKGDKMAAERHEAFKTRTIEFKMDVEALIKIKEDDPMRFAEIWQAAAAAMSTNPTARNTLLKVFDQNMKIEEGLKKLGANHAAAVKTAWSPSP